MFGFGSGEIILIAAIALIALGPKQLPEVARTIGRLLSEFRRASSQFQRALQEAADAETIREMKKTLEEAVEPAHNQLQQIQTEFQGHIQQSTTEIQKIAESVPYAPKAPETPASPQAVDEANQLAFDLGKKES
jgi:sec-independent protein translocase protein TatB